MKNLLAAFLNEISGNLGKALSDALAVELAAEKAEQRRLDIELPQALLPQSRAMRPNVALPGRGYEAHNLLTDFARDKLRARQDHGVERLLAVHQG